MPIPFDCPHCGLDTLVDDEYAGETGPCASCGKQITVPYQASGAGAGGAMAVQVYKRPARTSAGYIILLAIGGIAAAAFVISIAVTIFFPAIRAARSVAQQRSCEGNLRQIWMALQSYEAEHGSYPPAFIPDANGKPMHSWRVLLLPFLNEDGIYNRYDFDEAWNGPNNSGLMRYMPDVYGCPADVGAQPNGETSYMLLVGKDTFFPGEDTRGTIDMIDDPATTIVVVETPVQGVNWMEPRDLKAGRMQFVINGGFGLEMGSYHDNGAHVVMADGTVYFLNDMTPSDYVEGMSTIAGDEPIPIEALDGY